MILRGGIAEILESAEQPFDIVQEFAALQPKRKILLCDHLFMEGVRTFQNTVQILWPEADNMDMQRLEKFLKELKKSAH